MSIIFTTLRIKKSAFNIGNSANPLKRKELALIPALFCPSLEPRCHVSRGKTGEGDTGKRDDRHHTWTGVSIKGRLHREHSVILTSFAVAVDGVQIPERRYRYTWRSEVPTSHCRCTRTTKH